MRKGGREEGREGGKEGGRDGGREGGREAKREGEMEGEREDSQGVGHTHSPPSHGEKWIHLKSVGDADSAVRATVMESDSDS